MKFFFGLLKRVLHPHYGNYGGYYKRCENDRLGICPAPIDPMDAAFAKHDAGGTNKQLVDNLKQVHVSDLRYPLFGRVYRRATILLFSLQSRLGVEHP